MECVRREFCDLEGFISETPLNLDSQLEMLRVSLIVRNKKVVLNLRKKLVELSL